jgi:hypothetical protein
MAFEPIPLSGDIGLRTYSGHSVTVGDQPGTLYIYRGGAFVSARFIPNLWKNAAAWVYLKQTQEVSLTTSAEAIHELMFGTLEVRKAAGISDLGLEQRLHPRITIGQLTSFKLISAAVDIDKGVMKITLEYHGNTEVFNLKGWEEDMPVRPFVEKWHRSQFPGCSVR